MRKDVDRPPKEGDVRHVKRFLWMPKVAEKRSGGLEERWLETATWMEVFREPVKRAIFASGIWRTSWWIDDEEE